MIHFSRLRTLTIITGGVLSASLLQAELPSPGNPPGMIVSGSSSQGGYLGVVLHDVDNDSASALKLKDAHGAEIVTIDQDAPASKAGLKVHDVVVQMNGQRVEGVEQFRRMLHETPPGRTVSLTVMRDGQSVNLSVQLADRNTVALTPLDLLPQLPDGSSESQIQIYSPRSSGKHSGTNSLLGYFTRDRDYTGMELQPLSSGLAEYFGVHNGLGILVGTVFPNTPAAAAGIKAADVIQKVNGQPVVNVADWEKVIRANRGKPVQVTIIREKKEQTVTLVAGEAKNSGKVELPENGVPDAETLADLSCEIAGLNPDALAREIQKSMKDLDSDALQYQARKAMKSFDSQEFQRQLERQMDELKRSLKSFQFEQMD
jgi:membrane-associated protease RseP (regulator of RpoE activity)